jgi:hypothetical protein
MFLLVQDDGQKDIKTSKTGHITTCDDCGVPGTLDREWFRNNSQTRASQAEASNFIFPLLKSVRANPRYKGSPEYGYCRAKIQTTLDLYTQEDGDETLAAQGEYLTALGVATPLVQ